MMYIERTTREQNIIKKAYDFEIKAIEEGDSSRNPWFDEIHTWVDGKEIWEAINVAVELATRH